MWVYLYDSARVARRVFKVADRDLITILRRDRFFFPDVPFEPAMGSKPIMDGLHKECQRLVDPHKKRLADQRERKKVEVAPVKAAPKPAPVVVQQLRLSHKRPLWPRLAASRLPWFLPARGL